MQALRRVLTAICMMAVVVVGLAGANSARSGAAVPPHLGYGLNTWDQLDLAEGLGFDWIKLFEEASSPPMNRLPYKVLYRVFVNGYPADLPAYLQHVRELALAGANTVEAYEIGNEVNLRGAGFWGDQPVNPEAYAQLLCDLYPVIKQADPAAVVVSAGLAPVGPWSPIYWNDVMDETVYAQRLLIHMQAINAGELCIDAFGYHPHGFKFAPETPYDDPGVPNGFAFRSAERMRAVMEAHGAAGLSMWATEFGWIRDPSSDPWIDHNGQLSSYGWCKDDPGSDLGGFLWMLVTAQQQADYLTRAFQYADAHWPWMGPMFVWNLDLYYRGWACSHQKFYSLLYASDGNPLLRNFTPAYFALQAMPKRYADKPQLIVAPPAMTFLVEVAAPAPQTAVIRVDNLNVGVPLTWTVAISAAEGLTPLAAPITGVNAGLIAMQIDPGGVTQTGIYTAAITVGAVPTDTYGSPAVIPLAVIAVDHVYPAYLPVVSTSD